MPVVTHICENPSCQKTFERYQGLKSTVKYCSKRCSNARNPPIATNRICENPGCKKAFYAQQYLLEQGLGRFCSRKCHRTWKMTPEVTLARFWDNVAKTDTCWDWIGNLVGGYGQTSFFGKQKRATRYIYEVLHGPIPEGFYVCHTCDRPSCVRDEHLFLGTAQDNAQDASQKGRLHKIGGHNARLKAEDIPYIRNMKGIKTAVILGEEFHVSPITIRWVWSRRGWPHIT